MNKPDDASGAAVRKLWRRNGLIWAGLMLLLLLTLTLAYVPMGKFAPAVAIGIAAAKAMLVVMLFMELAGAKTLTRLAAMSGVVFLGALFLLTLADVLSRLAATPT
jgi:cytochrome c oxidase subunit IV